MKTIQFVSLVVCMFACGAASTQSNKTTPSFVVARRFAIGGEGGWDCLTFDSTTHRLYVTRSSHVMVVDAENGAVVGDIANTPGVHGVAIAPKLHKGFISCGREDSVLVFDTQSLKEIERIRVGANPDVIVFDPSTNLIVAANGRSNDATAIDASTDKVKGTIALGGKPEFAVPDGRGDLFVNLEDSNQVAEVSLKALKVVRSWPLAPAEGPTGVAFDKKHSVIFSTCGNGLAAVSDAKAGRLIGTAKIGNGPDGAAFDPELGLFFSPNGQDGTLSILKRSAAGGFELVQELATQKSARTIAFDSQTHTIYLMAAEFEPPASGQGRGRMIPGSAVILVIRPKS